MQQPYDSERSRGQSNDEGEGSARAVFILWTEHRTNCHVIASLKSRSSAKRLGCDRANQS